MTLWEISVFMPHLPLQYIAVSRMVGVKVWSRKGHAVAHYVCNLVMTPFSL